MPFRFDKLTIKAQEAVARAQEMAAEAGNPQIEPVHLLASLLQEEGDGIVRPVLEKMGANVAQLEKIVEAERRHLPKTSGGSPPGISPPLSKVLDAAQSEADGMKDEFVSTEHLLVALARTKSKAQDTLKLNAVGEKELLAALQKVRGSARVTDQTPEDKFQALQKYVAGVRATEEEGDWDRGRALIEEAIVLDTGFAMAYRKLAVEMNNRPRAFHKRRCDGRRRPATAIFQQLSA